MVVDANIIFAALIKNGPVANILFKGEFTWYVPAFCFEEISKYERVLTTKTKRANIHQAFADLLGLLNTLPRAEYDASSTLARKASPDPKDAAYLALTHHLGCELWSDDKALKNQELIPVVTTQELLFRAEL